MVVVEAVIVERVVAHKASAITGIYPRKRKHANRIPTAPWLQVG